MKISVIGAGSWGTALASVVAKKGNSVKLYARDKKQVSEINAKHINEKYLKGILLPENIEASEDLAYVLDGAKIVLFAVSSQALRKVLEQSKDFMPKQAIIVNVAKGIENGSLLRLSELIKNYFDNEIVVLSGPSHAEEVVKEMPTTLVSASENMEVARLIQDVFSTSYLRIYTNDDVVGVEFGGALKNIIALAAGISDGMGFGDNAKAALMTRGIKEIARLGRKLGARDETFAGLSGIGDLIVTCTSMHSRNRRCGILIGQGKSLKEAEKEISMVVEGLYTIRGAYELAKKHGVDMPIVNALYKVLYEEVDAKEALRALMFRAKKHEAEEGVDIL